MQTELQHILNQTDLMLQFAQSGDWEELSEVDESRSQSIKAYFAIDRPTVEPDIVRVFEDIQLKDKNILRMVLSAKDGIRLEMAQAGNGQRAIKAYSGL